jgi:hypothetical protein
MHNTRTIWGVCLLFIILNFGFNVPVSWAQEKSICPETYGAKGIPLQNQDLSESDLISTLTCNYAEQRSSEIKFKTVWSPNGKVYGDRWCQSQLVIENGIGTFNSDTYYVNIVSSGILPLDYEYAKDFMRLLFEKVKADSSSCDFKIENEKHILQMNENVTKNEPDTVKTNSTAVEQKTEKNGYIKQINQMQFPIIESLLFSVVGGVGYIVFKKYYKK